MILVRGRMILVRGRITRYFNMDNEPSKRKDDSMSENVFSNREDDRSNRGGKPF